MDDPSALRLLAVSVGNSRTAIGAFTGKRLAHARTLVNTSADALAGAILEDAREITGSERAAIVVASVNPGLSEPIIDAVDRKTEIEVYRVGEDVPVPIAHTLDPDARTGQDRLLAAAAAFDVVRQACVVIDAGTAVTIDFVDGAGVYHGGAILPGAKLMLRALHEGAAQLPEVEFDRPDEQEPFGKNTRDAMLNGVYFGIRGAVRLLLERYAERYGGYPQVIATGGDARLLFETDELVEHIADDLVLRGVALACDVSLSGATADSGAPDEQ